MVCPGYLLINTVTQASEGNRKLIIKKNVLICTIRNINYPVAGVCCCWLSEQEQIHHFSFIMNCHPHTGMAVSLMNHDISLLIPRLAVDF